MDDEHVDFDVLVREKRELMGTLNKMLERANNVDVSTSTDEIKVSTDVILNPALAQASAPFSAST